MNQKEFHRVFRYEDGILYCKKRDDVKREWNTRYAFKKAGNFRKDMYAMVCVHDKKYLAHRVIYIMHHGDMDSDVKIDHINCNHSDNKIENLRIATMGENSCNVPLSSRNTSGFKGVTWNKRAQRWRDSAQLGNVKVAKNFINKNEAANWITGMRNIIHKQFANHGDAK